MFTIIACIGENNELGKGGSLIWHIKEDLKFFKDTTMGHAVLMGYNTWASLPKQLSGRDCYVLMHRTEKFFEDPEARADNLAKGLDIDSPEDLPDNLHLITSLDEFVDHNKGAEYEIFVMGGASVYEQMMPFCDKMILTEVQALDADADAYFPEVDTSKWARTELMRGNEDGIDYVRELYTRK